MKFLSTLCLSLLLAGATSIQASEPVASHTTIKYGMYPDKTICIKHPSAGDTKTFFSGSQVYFFEIYNVGSAADIAKIIHTVKANKDVADFTQGVVTGEFTAFTLSLKSNKDKAWFIALFKKAGLNTIKINNSEVMSVDHM
jgi:hypothetical protein